MSIYSILVDLETLKNINRFICQTSDTSDEESVVINENNLLSALSVLDSYFETKEQMAAALLRSLVIAHGFENGNKRTAFIASTMICPCKCSHQKAADITLKIAKGELKDVDMIAKQLFTLNEDLFVDIPEVEYQLDSNIELKGPEPGEDTGVAGLLLDLIGKVADNINEFNQLQPNLENYPEISEMIKDFADDENEKLGKIQTALKTISPNAELIMNGAVEAEQELDPGSPLDESLNEERLSLDEKIMASYINNQLNNNVKVESIDTYPSDGYVSFIIHLTPHKYDNDGYGYEFTYIFEEEKSVEDFVKDIVDFLNTDVINESLNESVTNVVFVSLLGTDKFISKDIDMYPDDSDSLFTDDFTNAKLFDEHTWKDELQEILDRYTIGYTINDFKANAHFEESLSNESLNDKVFVVKYTNWNPFNGWVELMDKLDKNGEGEKHRFTDYKEMNKFTQELADKGYKNWQGYPKKLEESIEQDELDQVTQARFDLFHRGNYSLDQLRNDLESLLQDGLDPIEFLGIDAEALDPEIAYSYSVIGEVDPDNVSSISFDFGNDGSYDYGFIEDCIAKAVANQNLEWGEYVDYEDITYGYKDYLTVALDEAYNNLTIKDYLEDVYTKLNDLRDSLYALHHAVKENRDLESAVEWCIDAIEDHLFVSSLKEIDDYLNESEEVDDEI